MPSHSTLYIQTCGPLNPNQDILILDRNSISLDSALSVNIYQVPNDGWGLVPGLSSGLV